MQWESLEPIIQSEESQKEKNKYVSELIYGIQKGGTEETIRRAAMETQTQETDLWTEQGKEMLGRIERIALKHMHYHM